MYIVETKNHWPRFPLPYPWFVHPMNSNQFNFVKLSSQEGIFGQLCEALSVVNMSKRSGIETLGLCLSYAIKFSRFFVRYLQHLMFCGQVEHFFTIKSMNKSCKMLPDVRSRGHYQISASIGVKNITVGSSSLTDLY